MTELALIGGSGLLSLPELREIERFTLDTPWGPPSDAIARLGDGSGEVLFLARHGAGHRIAPHAINYRANIWALRELGAREVISVNTVGGIHPRMKPGQLVVPDQLVDYTWGRAHSYETAPDGGVLHVDFTQPFSEPLRQRLVAALEAQGQDCQRRGTYGCTQGPRLETAAEVARLRRDGCDLVGMTVMPEAALARELDLEYAAVCGVVNWAAGLGPGIDMQEIRSNQARCVGLLKPALFRLCDFSRQTSLSYNQKA